MEKEQYQDENLASLAKANKNNFKVFENLSSNPSDYLMVDCIGKGNFGDVFKAIYLPQVDRQLFPQNILHRIERFNYNENILKFLNYLDDEYFVAIKIIDLEETDDDIDILCQEIQFLTTLQSKQKDNQNIVKYYKTFINDQKMWIIMEYCGGGSAYDLIKNMPMQISEKSKIEHLSENQIASIALEVINGLLILHEKGSVHRDIKLANILLTKDGKIKLSDFGVSGKLNNTLKKRETFVGTPYWMAPEVILNGYTDSNTGEKIIGYNEKADIWSLGITIIELVNKRPPLIEHEPMQIVAKIPDLEPPSLKNNDSWKCSKYLISFVDSCLKKNPEQRATATELLNHKFIKKNKCNSPNIVLLIDHVCCLKLKKSVTKIDKGYNGLLVWCKKPRYYSFGNRRKFSELVDKENKLNIDWCFTKTLKTPNLTKRLSKNNTSSATLVKNSTENYTPMSMKTPVGTDTSTSELEKKETNSRSENESQLEDSNNAKKLNFSKTIHVYNDILLPVFSDLIKRSVYPETQLAVIQLLKKFHETEKNQPGFSNVFIEEIAYKLNELELHI
ncbi:hypothetical protein QEN19_002985 [Hanseniaspora menglaensis]